MVDWLVLAPAVVRRRAWESRSGLPFAMWDSRVWRVLRFVFIVCTGRARVSGLVTRLFTKYISAQNVRSAVCYFARRSLFRRHFHTRAWRVGAHVFVCAYPYTHHHTRMCALLDF